MAIKLLPLYREVSSLTSAEEATLATSLAGEASYSSMIWNSTLSKARYWNGSAFATVPDIDTFLDPAQTAKATSLPNASYRTVLDCTGSHIAGRVAGTYAFGHGDALAITGTGTLYPLNTIYIATSDYPTLDTITTKLRIRAQLYTNDVAPTGNFTLGLYPITRPATSGGAGLCIYTLGTVVTGSTGATFTTPVADGLLNAASSDFALPIDGHYVIGVVTTATVAVSSHIHISAQLQLRNN